ncbi:hypothetical protein Glove_692g21 [Diversispora epigaea]|uniref:Protein kinase domain-containing protein n=1 Tax=Diversispora epigaea TaxID=1348612 RepID=A0A397G220_9GLOM|nr:hypothetical protein Glove_692g21 [Diversispora epigaea]
MSISNRKKELLQSALKKGSITEFDYNTFEDITPIARGGFGEVARAYAKNLQKNIALKSLYDKEFSVNFLRECINNNAIHNYDNIVKFLGVSTDSSKGKHYLVFQYAEDGNLRTYLQNNFNELNWNTKIIMAKDITRGLFYIHQANIVHRDLHSKNILVHKGKLMISDLGLSKSLDTDSRSQDGGMYAYTDPEYIKNAKTYKRNKSSDIYSLGVLFWELSSGNPPFRNFPMLEVCRKVTSGLREKPIQGTPVDYINIYSSAWKGDPYERPTIEYIRDSIENIKLENLYNNYDENDQSQVSINNNISLDSYSNDIVSCSRTLLSFQNWAESLGRKQAENDNNGKTNNHILVSSEVITKVAYLNLPDIKQDFNISAYVWAEVDPLPNNRNNLKFSININDCRMGPMLSKNWPSLGNIGSGYFLDSVEIWVTPIEDGSMSDEPLYKVKNGPWPQQFNKDIDISKVDEYNNSINASINGDSGIILNHGRRNGKEIKSATKEWELTVDGSCTTGLHWRYQYTADKNFDRRKNFAPGEHSCHWITLETMSGFHITITQVLRCEITDGWRKLKPGTKSKLMLICPKLSHTLKITFNSLKNFDENFANLKNSEKLHEGRLKVTLEKNKSPHIEKPKNSNIGNIDVERKVE